MYLKHGYIITQHRLADLERKSIGMFASGIIETFFSEYEIYGLCLKPGASVKTCSGRLRTEIPHKFKEVLNSK